MTTSQDPAHDKDDHTPATLAPPDDRQTNPHDIRVGDGVEIAAWADNFSGFTGCVTEIPPANNVAFVKLNAPGTPFEDRTIVVLLAHLFPYIPTAPPPTEPEMLEPIPLPDEWRTRPGKPATPAAPFEAGDIVQINETEPAHFRRVGIVTKVEFTGELRVKLLDPVELEWFDPENLTLAPGSLYYIPTDIPTSIPPTLQALALQHLTSQVEQLKLITSLRYQIGEHIDSNVETALENGLRELVRSIMKLAAGDPEVSIRV